MKCDVCGAEVDTLIGGMGRKMCDWCAAVEIRNRENTERQNYGRRYTDQNRGYYLIALMLISTLYFILGIVVGKYLL